MYRIKLFLLSLVDHDLLIARVINKLNLIIIGLGFSEIDAISPGDIKSKDNCPLANTLAAAIFQPIEVLDQYLLIIDRGLALEIATIWGSPTPCFNGVECFVRMPPELAEFVRRFDKGFLPSLEESTPPVRVIANSNILADTNWLEKMDDQFELDYPPVV